MWTPISSVWQGASGDESTKDLCHCYHSQMARPALVPRSAGDVGGGTIQDSTGKWHNDLYGGRCKTKKKPALGNICLEDIWRSRLCKSGWSARAKEHFWFSMLDQYNCYVNRYFEFCVSHNIEFPSTSEDAFSSFLCTVGWSTARPKSVLHGTLAALVCLFNAVGTPHPMKSGLSQKLVHGIIKGRTAVPMMQTPVMPHAHWRLPCLVSKVAWKKGLANEGSKDESYLLVGYCVHVTPIWYCPTFRNRDTGSCKHDFWQRSSPFWDAGDMLVSFHGIKKWQCQRWV